MSLQIAVAMIERQGEWLLQLRDDIEGREVEEEINWVAGAVSLWFSHQEPHRVLHVFHVQLTAPLEILELREGQDMVLADLDALRSGAIWSPKRQERRPLAPSLQLALDHLERQGLPDPSASQHP
ncbi:MAG: NUDIX hydrolase [Cyanobacteria bacterium]|nr:NUDIX hydrolase [Cyanobacteriota bacterium]